jgi:hypothetical protein
MQNYWRTGLGDPDLNPSYATYHLHRLSSNHSSHGVAVLTHNSLENEGWSNGTFLIRIISQSVSAKGSLTSLSFLNHTWLSWIVVNSQSLLEFSPLRRLSALPIPHRGEIGMAKFLHLTFLRGNTKQQESEWESQISGKNLRRTVS